MFLIYVVFHEKSVHFAGCKEQVILIFSGDAKLLARFSKVGAALR
jgi:hypothetical protein